ncbi:hypothetical protein COOONC_28712 [Cooperia oncophora]
MLSGLDQNTLMQIHQLFGGDESRTRAILEQYQQQQRNYQQYHQQLVQQQPSMDQLYLTYHSYQKQTSIEFIDRRSSDSMCDKNSSFNTRSKRPPLQMRQQHAAMLVWYVRYKLCGKLYATLAPVRRQQALSLGAEDHAQGDRFRRNNWRRVSLSSKRQEQVRFIGFNKKNSGKLKLQGSSCRSKSKHHDITAANIDKNTIAMVIDEDIRGMEKQVRRLEEEERTYQKKKIQAEQMITSAFRINSTMQDFQASRNSKRYGAQDNMRVVEHSGSRPKEADNLRENGSTSGVIVCGLAASVKGGERFAQSQQQQQQQQQAVKAPQPPPTTLSLAAQAQAQQFHLQMQQQQHKNLGIGIRQPTADSKPVVHEELTNSHAAAQAAHAASHSAIAPPEIRRKSGLEMLNIPPVSVARHPQRRPTSPSSGGVGIQRPPMNRPARSIMGGVPSYSALVVNTSHGATGSPQMSSQHMSPSVSASSSSTASNVYSHFQQSLNACSPAAAQLNKTQPMASPVVCVPKTEVPSVPVQPLASPAIPSTSGVLSSVSAFQEPTTSTSTTIPPPPTLQFLATSTVSGPPTYEPISPDDGAPTSPVTRAEAPSATPASSQGSRMFSALDFDFPLAVAPSSTAPPPLPPSLAPPLAELLRTAGTEPIATAMTFEPLSDDDD